jgi:hypothetical protein
LVFVKNRDERSTCTGNLDWLKKANITVLVNDCLGGSNHWSKAYLSATTCAIAKGQRRLFRRDTWVDPLTPY